jgi:hypothetical protein
LVCAHRRPRRYRAGQVVGPITAAARASLRCWALRRGREARMEPVLVRAHRSAGGALHASIGRFKRWAGIHSSVQCARQDHKAPARDRSVPDLLRCHQYAAKPCHEPMTNHQWNGRPLVLRECQELRREITTDIALNATRDAPCSARTSLTEANTSVAACHDAVSQPAAAARGSLRAPVPLSSTIPSAKYSGAGSSLMFWNA